MSLNVQDNPGGAINLVGAKTKYNPKTTPQLAEQYAGLGYTISQIAKRLHISRQTLYDWRKLYPEFLEGIDRARGIVDDKIEQKLFNRATGIRYTETTREKVGGKMVITKKVSKFAVPDVAAMFIWLKNRRPEQWRDRRDVKHSGAIIHFDSIVYDAVNGNGNGNGNGKDGNGKPVSVPANMDN